MTARAAAMAGTRRRIVRAACAVYARVGFRSASMQAVAQEAKVSPATVLNHFDTSSQLLTEALAELTARLGLPHPGEIEAIEDLGQRMAKVTRALATCYQRGDELYRVYSRDQDMKEVRAASAAFYRHVDALIRAALGPGLRERRNVEVMRAFTGWATFQSLRGAGMSAQAAAAAVADVLLSWLSSRRRTKPPGRLK